MIPEFSGLMHYMIRDELRQTSFGLYPEYGVALSLGTRYLHCCTPVNMTGRISN